MPEKGPRPSSDEYFILWVLMAQCRDAISRAREREFARYGISNDRRAVLYIIQNHGGRATPVEIARDIFRELHSVTGMLNRMEKSGLITKHTGTGRSKTEVSLTEEGLEVFNRTLHNEADERVFSVLTKRERERLALYLWKLRRRVLQDLGIPEWQLNLALNPGAGVEGQGKTERDE
jgi:DNA-binding MarR family transcriptional regulator